MMGRAGPRGDWGETSWACDGGLTHFSSWFTLAGWVMVLVVGPRSIELRGTIVCCCFDFVAPGSERPDHASKSKSQESPERRRTAKGYPLIITTLSSHLSQSISYTAFYTVVFCQVFYYIYVVSISARVPLNIQN
jgi:hypothetical protein